MDIQVGGAGQGRKCSLHLKIAWEGTGNRNFGPTWKCFLNYQEIRLELWGQPPPHRDKAVLLSLLQERNRESGRWRGLGGSSLGKHRAQSFASFLTQDICAP